MQKKFFKGFASGFLTATIILVTVALYLRTDLEFPPHRRKNAETEQEVLEQHIQETTYEIAEKVRISAYDFESQEELSYNEDTSFYPASMIKTLVLLTALLEVERGNLNLEGMHRYTENDQQIGETEVLGTGKLRYEEPDQEYTLRELLELMIAESDNIAANIVMDLLGREKLTASAHRFNLAATDVNRRMYEIESEYPPNSSNAADLTRILTVLERGELISKELSQMGIEMMIEEVNKNRTARNLLDRMTVANKTGTTTSVVGDMALIYPPNRPPLALTIVLEEPVNHDLAERELGDLTSLIVDLLSNSGEE